MSVSIIEESGSTYYDIQLQEAELDREMEILNNKSQCRIDDNDKLSLFYQHELQQWLTRIDKKKIIWEKKRNDLSENCTKLQESVQNKWSSTNTNLQHEKEKYYNIITKLLPEYQKVIERKQMREISEYESKVSLIQERRHIADVAFEKEKKLLSLISIRHKQLEKVQNEEKQEALIREHERKSIVEKEIIPSKKDEFVDRGLQQHIIRKQVTSELEKNFANEINDIKTKLLQLQKDTNKSTPNYTQQRFDNDEDIDVNEQKHDEEEKKNINDDHEEGNETQPVAQEFNAEQHEDYNNNNNNDCNFGIYIDGDEEAHLNIVDNDDTAKIEQAIGMIEVNHHRQIRSLDVTENVEDKQETQPINEKKQIKEAEQAKRPKPEKQLQIKQETEQKPQIQSKMKRSFKARTSKNRLQFSVLESPNKENNLVANDKMMQESKDHPSKHKLSNANIKSINDFDDEKPPIISNQDQVDNVDSSDDEFDF